jgi:hypothetical protein
MAKNEDRAAEIFPGTALILAAPTSAVAECKPVFQAMAGVLTA